MSDEQRLNKLERKLNVYVVILAIITIISIPAFIEMATYVKAGLAEVSANFEVVRAQHDYIEQADPAYITETENNDFFVPANNFPSGQEVTLTPDNAFAVDCARFRCEYSYPAADVMMPGVYTLETEALPDGGSFRVERGDDYIEFNLLDESPTEFVNIVVNPKDMIRIYTNDDFAIKLTPQEQLISLDDRLTPGYYIWGETIAPGEYTILQWDRFPTKYQYEEGQLIEQAGVDEYKSEDEYEYDYKYEYELSASSGLLIEPDHSSKVYHYSDKYI